MRIVFCLAAVAALMVDARAIAADELDAFHAALARSDSLAAATLFNARRAEQSGTSGKRDHLLDHMAGELTTRVPTFRTTVYLERARDSASNPAERAELNLLLGHAHARSSRFDEAVADYRAATTEPPSTRTGRTARTALAQLQLSRAPGEVEGLVAPVIAAATGPADRWEAELLASRAAALTGDMAGARQRLAAAWADAASVPGPRQAVRRTAEDMALDAFAAGNRGQGLALEELGRNANTMMLETPRCGTDGIRPDDYVVVEAAWDGERFGFSPVRASRPGIARDFIDAIAPYPPRLEPPALLYTTLRCAAWRTPLPVGPKAAAPADWLADKQIYPFFPLVTDLPGQMVEIQEEISRIERRFGTDSVLLVPVLLALADGYLAQAQVEANSGYVPRAREAATRALALLKAAGATPVTTLWLEREIRSGRFADPGSRPKMTTILTQAYDEDIALNGADPVFVVRWAIQVMGQMTLPVEVRLGIAEHAVATLAAHKVPLDSQPGQALVWTMTGPLQEKGDFARLASLTRAAKLPADLCDVAEVPPRLSPEALQLIGPDQYPADALQTMLAGTTTLTMDVDAKGAVSNLRVISAYPPEVFDAVTVKQASGFTFAPATTHGKPVACRGMRQRVRWSIPTGEGAEPVSPPPS